MNVFIKKSKANNATKDNEFRKYKSTDYSSCKYKKTALLLHLEERYSVGSMKMFWKLCTKNTGE